MEVFFTPPNSHLELTEKGSNNFYCLGQIYVKNEEYRKYALQAKDNGRFIILDSGVGDHGKPLTNRELFDVALELKPDEVIPLDTLYHSAETINNVIEMHKWLDEAGLVGNIKILMCPQGDTYEEYMKCYDWAIEDGRVSSIGLSKKTVPHIIFKANADEYIGEARNILYDILKTQNKIKKPIHLLGSGGPKEYQHYKNDSLIRSTDSCVAIWEGMNHQLFINPHYKRIPTPANYFERDIDSIQMEYVKRNIKYFYDLMN